jgi:hypothetical protein
MASSPHNMRIPDELWALVVAEADSRAQYIKAVDASYARYPRTRIIIDALIARYRNRLPENYTPEWGTPPVTLVESGSGATDSTEPPPNPGQASWH